MARYCRWAAHLAPRQYRQLDHHRWASETNWRGRKRFTSRFLMPRTTHRRRGEGDRPYPSTHPPPTLPRDDRKERWCIGVDVAEKGTE
ncbi:hypothetical protein E2C01_056277 [Portunus trituberculatus]|uniref:Uncharacterized protein n=1 Tax=Portunus trituberculatus TaxID=210409 RepID=A0A5B7GWX8_PORTR|nr:hypothetical protein [Portunus trituberculatus]